MSPRVLHSTTCTISPHRRTVHPSVPTTAFIPFLSSLSHCPSSPCLSCFGLIAVCRMPGGRRGRPIRGVAGCGFDTLRLPVLLFPISQRQSRGQPAGTGNLSSLTHQLQKLLRRKQLYPRRNQILTKT